MDDLISRRAVIDALHTWFRDGFDEDKWWNSTHVLAAIEGIPPAQQRDKWETCFECPLSHGCPKIKGCTNEQAIERASQIPNDCPLSVQPETHWIPRSKRLPEESGKYLVTVLDGIGKRTTSAPYHLRSKSWTLTGRMTYWKVIAWMPFPEPYRGGGKE